MQRLSIRIPSDIPEGVQAQFDRSHDGVSQSGELTHVAASSLTGFKLDYRESRRRDKYGNQYSYRSVATADDGSRAIAVFDVSFATSAGNR
jgi:hypothetical protein